MPKKSFRSSRTQPNISHPIGHTPEDAKRYMRIIERLQAKLKLFRARKLRREKGGSQQPKPKLVRAKFPPLKKVA